MNVLVACEESQRVCIAFRERGHNAFSCDILPCSGGHPEWHIMQDVVPLLDGRCSFKTMAGIWHSIDEKWDMIIAFPPCTHLAVSGARQFEQKRKDGRQQQGIDFFMMFANANCPRVAIENPIGIMSTYYRRPDQIIQPWQFGDNVGKSTCLWLKGLPLLVPDITERPPAEYHTWTTKDGKLKRQEMWYYATRCLQHSERGKAASVTFPGIARAMATQWSEV